MGVYVLQQKVNLFLFVCENNPTWCKTELLPVVGPAGLIIPPVLDPGNRRENNGKLSAILS